MLKLPRATFLALLVGIAWLTPAIARADGCFVMPPFVWNKHKDINEPTQKAILLHDGRREDLILQVKYAGPVSEFGWLIPVPALPTVRKAPMECFYELSRYTQERWERHFGWAKDAATHGAENAGLELGPVKVIEVKTVGAYQIAVLSASDAGSLQAWLDTNHFSFPHDKTGMIDSYLKQQWYFVAVRIRLSDTQSGSRIPSKPERSQADSAIGRKLAQGELHPLHLSFETERCVFPLKISSLNGRPSEVQVYVLSTQPLVERTMFEKQRVLRSREDTPLPYAQVTSKDLPRCTKQLPRLKSQSWWLTKQTWTFKPKDMRDLDFQPLVPVLAEKLKSQEGQEGYAAACNLAQFGPEGRSTLLAALNSADPQVRAAVAASIAGTSSDTNLLQALGARLNDPHAGVRLYAAQVAGFGWDAGRVQPLIGLLRDPNANIRAEAVTSLVEHESDTAKHFPVLLHMVREGQPESRLAALKVLLRLRVDVPRADVASFFNVPDQEAVTLAYSCLRPRDLSCDEAAPLLRNPLVFTRLLGLNFLKQTHSRQAVELALPLLRDREPKVRSCAQNVLQTLTAQRFRQNQPQEWERWWAANKTTFSPAFER